MDTEVQCPITSATRVRPEVNPEVTHPFFLSQTKFKLHSPSLASSSFSSSSVALRAAWTVGSFGSTPGSEESDGVDVTGVRENISDSMPEPT